MRVCAGEGETQPPTLAPRLFLFCHHHPHAVPFFDETVVMTRRFGELASDRLLERKPQQRRNVERGICVRVSVCEYNMR